MEFRYCEEKISFEDFFIFLQAVEEDFVPPLLDRIDINAYYNKINEYANNGRVLLSRRTCRLDNFIR